ncbi:MAG TPA: Smr/MutS family protein [Gammaproteobacteria bacterium]|nr:Smr/MutS family protein [Gammaproteobacteria bacterium]
MSDRQDQTEQDLFISAMEGVRPLTHDRVAPTRSRPAPIPRQALADEREVMAELLADEYDPDALASGEELMYARPGLQRRILRRLRRGHYSLAAELDLHGMTVRVAQLALQEFLLNCRRRDYRCVRIIHGKGRRSSNQGPVLKGKVDRWLRQREDVLAFCSAQPTDGGTGAVYVLLRHDRSAG